MQCNEFYEVPVFNFYNSILCWCIVFVRFCFVYIFFLFVVVVLLFIYFFFCCTFTSCLNDVNLWLRLNWRHTVFQFLVESMLIIYFFALYLLFIFHYVYVFFVSVFHVWCLSLDNILWLLLFTWLPFETKYLVAVYLNPLVSNLNEHQKWLKKTAFDTGIHSNVKKRIHFVYRYHRMNYRNTIVVVCLGFLSIWHVVTNTHHSRCTDIFF